MTTVHEHYRSQRSMEGGLCHKRQCNKDENMSTALHKRSHMPPAARKLQRCTQNAAAGSAQADACNPRVHADDHNWHANQRNHSKPAAVPDSTACGSLPCCGCNKPYWSRHSTAADASSTIPKLACKCPAARAVQQLLIRICA